MTKQTVNGNEAKDVDLVLSESQALLPTSSTFITPNHFSDRYGYALMLVAAMSFAFMALLARMAQNEYKFPTSSSVLIQGLVQVVLGLLSSFCFQDFTSRLMFSRKTAILLTLRSVIGAVGYGMEIASLANIPAGDASGLYVTAPIFTMLLSAILLQERLSKFELVATVFAAVGATLVAGPAHTKEVVGSTARLIGSLTALTGAALDALAFVATRSLGERVHFMHTVLGLGTCMVAMGIVMGGYRTFFLFQNAIASTGMSLILASAVCSFVGQVAFSRALQICRAGPASLLASSDLPLVYFLGFLILHEIPSLTRAIGSVLILIAAVIIGFLGLHT